MASTTNFIERTKQFWKWFSDNEGKLSELTQARGKDDGAAEAGSALVSEGVSLIADDIYFNIGGDHEFTFAVNANNALFFIYPYITANLPKQYRDKWKFFPCMQGTGGQNFGFRMHGADVETDNVKVSATPSEDGKTVDLRFYAKEWETLEEQNCYGAFYTLFDLCVGEALACAFVNKVEKAQTVEDGMFALTGLEQWIRDKFCEDGKDPNPADRHFVYEMEPQEDLELRRDVIIGGANCAPLLNDYLSGDDSCYQTFAKFGTKPVFLYFYYDFGTKERAEVLCERNALMDKLEEEVLGERGSGNEIGLMLGGAMGVSRAYIDLLLYDEQLFMEKARKLLADFPYMVLGKEFYPSGQEFLLTDHTMAGFKERLSQLHEASAHKEIIKIIEAMPAENKDFTLINLYARALNNDDQEGKAVEVLESIREQGENDALWNWRMGFALYYLDREVDSIPYLERAIELGDDNPETAALLQEALTYLEDE
ncbi:MAG: hypothetical protein FWF95_06570 [Syntrophorhabdaceae bacterium]|nr:hypothetical protein [Syntrophorhabdaceae bacterium]